ncbi:cation diffusion facilitator family transporter [Flammeovirga kamogawensis]|uniref:Cation transporter n=1 Tax=Flammeovirga kamogawensis TaxID=373891 RepID=A0ABX8GQY3_9BACT|nr:cation diffusion facilitator family transporter [Flammeovirga kamogawensis]MBB6462105.1 cation diffusion facilitator family transporter [Flammeovirga kamogawensis]QWG05839.1 cation transporter [Flammeovirga kamogawensis]TRX67664.1 cation transporter [Flammeovirga kamogawensis]
MISKEEKKKAFKTTWYSIIGNIILTTVKGTVGIIGNSQAMIADAIESCADIISSFVVLAGLNFSTKAPDENHPYGHGKIEPFATFITIGFLITSALIIGVQSIERISSSDTSIPSSYTLIVLGIIILIKYSLYKYVLHKGKQLNSSSLEADAGHHKSDAIISLSAFIGISISIFGGEGYEHADSWAALFAVGIILFNSYLLFRPAFGEIMDENLYDDLIDLIKQEAVKVDGVIDTEKCFVRKMGFKFYVDLHIIVDGEKSVREGHDIAHAVKDSLKADFNEIADILIHVEPSPIQP